ncbi:hypothetical protein QQP08_026525, partial [Theobroma cacao]
MSIHRSNENQAQQKSSESTKGKRIHELGWHWMKFNHANGGFSLTVTARVQQSGDLSLPRPINSITTYACIAWKNL